MSRLPPCDHDECPPTHCLRVGKSIEQGELAVTPLAEMNMTELRRAGRETYRLGWSEARLTLLWVGKQCAAWQVQKAPPKPINPQARNSMDTPKQPPPVASSAIVLPDLLPIPKALYPCAHCRDEFSRYAEELYWWAECKCWVCDDCWESESHGEKGIRLDAEILRQNGKDQA
jgi:hypothetical protein